MKWDPTVAGWLKKSDLVERIDRDLVRGRLCVVDRCVTRSTITRLVYIGRRRPLEAGFCSRHHRRLERELEERGRPQPDGTTLLDNRRVGRFRPLEPDEILDGPLTDQDDLDDA